MKDDITRDVEASMGTTKKLAAADKMGDLMALFTSSAQDGLENLTDLLVDLHHWADVNEIDWDDALSTAERHHDAETDDEDEIFEIGSAGVLRGNATPTGFVCKQCGGPSPIGVGYVTVLRGGSTIDPEAAATVTKCECGYSVKSEKRTAFVILIGQQDEHGYIPSLVTEGERGHSPLMGGPDGSPWHWGTVYEEARTVCATANADKGLSEQDVLDIVASSMRD